MTTLREAATHALEALELVTDLTNHDDEIYDAIDALKAALAEPVQEEEGLIEFLADLQRSRMKYPNNRRMFDGLMGEVDELRRAYAGDGDIRAEAFDVAVCAFRIATEGDSGGNTMLKQAEPVQEPVAWQERQAKRMRDGIVTEWTDWYPCQYRTADKARAEVCDQIPYEWRPLYTAPPQRKPLPASDIVTMYDESPTGDSDMIAFARAIERAHGIT